MKAFTRRNLLQLAGTAGVATLAASSARTQEAGHRRRIKLHILGEHATLHVGTQAYDGRIKDDQFKIEDPNTYSYDIFIHYTLEEIKGNDKLKIKGGRFLVFPLPWYDPMFIKIPVKKEKLGNFKGQRFVVTIAPGAEAVIRAKKDFRMIPVQTQCIVERENGDEIPMPTHDCCFMCGDHHVCVPAGTIFKCGNIEIPCPEG